MAECLQTVDSFIDAFGECESQLPQIKNLVEKCHWCIKLLPFETLLQYYEQIGKEILVNVDGNSQRLHQDPLSTLYSADSFAVGEEFVHEYFDLHSTKFE